MISFRLIAATAALLWATAVAADQPKLHPVETYTVVYQQSGVAFGTHTVHSRAFGLKRAELADVMISTRGVNLPRVKSRTVIDGKWMTRIDEGTGQREVSADPTYDAVVKAMAAGGALEAIMLNVWKAKPTGKTNTYAGERCRAFVSADKRNRYCATEDGILLYISQGGSGVRFERTATTLRREDGGPDSAFTIEEASAP